MNQRLISETAFNMARALLSKFGNNLGDEERRQHFEDCFNTCRAGVEAYCQQDQEMQHNLRPLKESHEPATAK